MGTERVTVWLACACGKLMASFTKEDTADFVKIGPIDETVVQIPEEEVHEYVLIPASEYRQPTAELSPVAKLIVDAALRIESQHRIGSVAALSEAACIVEKAMEAARKIEGKAHE